jgi:hypothetical protein
VLFTHPLNRFDLPFTTLTGRPSAPARQAARLHRGFASRQRPPAGGAGRWRSVARRRERAGASARAPAVNARDAPVSIAIGGTSICRDAGRCREDAHENARRLVNRRAIGPILLSGWTGSAPLEYAEHDGSDEGECDIGGNDAHSVDQSHRNAPWLTTLPALNVQPYQGVPGEKSQVPCLSGMSTGRESGPTWLKSREINALKSP